MLQDDHQTVVTESVGSPVDLASLTPLFCCFDLPLQLHVRDCDIVCVQVGARDQLRLSSLPLSFIRFFIFWGRKLVISAPLAGQ